MEMIKSAVGSIGIALIILDYIISCYGIIMNKDRHKKLKIFIQQILQTIMLYGGYRAISFL